jgi:hypothetical protein
MKFCWQVSTQQIAKPQTRLKINKYGDLYSAYLALPGSSRRWEQSVYVRQANSMSTQVQPLLAVNSKSEQKVNSLPPLGAVIFGMLTPLSDRPTPRTRTKQNKNIMQVDTDHWSELQTQTPTLPITCANTHLQWVTAVQNLFMTQIS